MLFLLLAGVLLCGVAVVLVLDAAFRPAAERRASFRRVAAYAATKEAVRVPTERRASLFEVFVPLLSRIALRLTPASQTDQLELRLAAAGVRRLNAQQFLALKSALAAVGIVLGFALAGFGLGGLVMALVFAVASLLGPDLILARLVRGRADRLSADLPEAIDQIAISLEAGLGFDAAVSYYVQRSRSPLGAELRVMLSELRMGESRVQALKHLSERVPSEEMRNFVQMLVQSEGVGISRAAILRTQASDLRQRRQLAAEERAQKAPVKMLFPIVIFILPVIFIVILGPAFRYASTVFGTG